MNYTISLSLPHLQSLALNSYQTEIIMNFDAIKLYNRYQVWLKPEAQEQALLVIWLEQNGYKFTSIPNSTWTKSFKQKIVNTLTGLRPGLCDMLIDLK